MSSNTLGFTQTDSLTVDSIDAKKVTTNLLSSTNGISGGQTKISSLITRPSSAALAGVPTRIIADPAPALPATLLSGYIRCDSNGGAFNVTTDTANNITAAIEGNAAIGDYFDLVIDELPGGAANNVTLVGGAGVTVVGTATVQSVSGRFRFVVTSIAAGANLLDAIRIDGA